MPRDHPRYNPVFQAPPDQSIPLNDLEKRVLTLRAQGHRSPRIAQELGYSRGHIENVLQSAARKLGGRNVTDTVVKAMRGGQISWLACRPDRET